MVSEKAEYMHTDITVPLLGVDLTEMHTHV